MTVFKCTVVLAVAAFSGLVCLGVKGSCDKPCPLVKCVVVEPDDCKPDELFVSRDGLCYCCDTCVNKAGTDCSFSL